MSRYDYPSPYREKSTSPWAVLAVLLLGVAVIGVVLWGLGIIHFGREAPAPHDPNVKPRDPSPRGERNPDERERISIYKSTKHCVVNVDTLAYSLKNALSEEENRLGTGSGFVWDDDGRIVTNFHVVRDALTVNRKGEVVIHPDRKILVTLATGESLEARLVGIAADSDLAVIQLKRIPSDHVKKIPIGKSDDLEVGQTVYAIGSPFGQKLSFTQGIISALDRSIQSPTQHIIQGAIQTDAALNPGNSGGPLLDKDGRLIGVNTAITSPSGGSVGIGYAIPVDTVNQVVTELIKTGRQAQPYIGINVVLEERYVRQLGYAKGVLIRSVRPRSPAAAAGLESGDLILKVNNQEIIGVADLQRVLSTVKVGETLVFTISRDGDPSDVPVKVEGI